MLFALLRPHVAEAVNVVARFDLVLVLVAAAAVQSIHSYGRITLPIPAEAEEMVDRGFYPETTSDWIKVFVLGVAVRIREMDERLRASLAAPGAVSIAEIRRDFASVAMALLAVVGLLFLMLIPLLGITWWLLERPGLRPHLNEVLEGWSALQWLERPLRPLLRFGIAVSKAVGLGDADEELLSQEDGVTRAKRLLIGLVMLNVLLSIVLLVLLSAVSSMFRMM
ncbi:unnamed protein product [Effrenium voratum]|uniref:Uncharacterized protein n=1 Tax=Effrenium voratum TaxID=2562239 RepID=A0AA36JSN8_9DINO|nr:unnamed protein product [Effrenium voratum]CAJ1440322.1 unnamed protein product [Effrenium voratum]